MRRELESRLSAIQPSELLLPSTGVLSKQTEQVIKQCCDATISAFNFRENEDAPIQVSGTENVEPHSEKSLSEVVQRFLTSFSHESALSGKKTKSSEHFLLLFVADWVTC